MQSPLKALLAFRTIEEFVARHKGGTEAEFASTQKFVDETNKEENKFQAWILSTIRETPKRTEYLVIVQPGQDGERKIPQQGEPSKMRIVFGDDSVTRFWDAYRIENNMSQLEVNAASQRGLATFRVTAHVADSHPGIAPLIEKFQAPALIGPSECPVNGRVTPASSNGSSDSGIGDCTSDQSTAERANSRVMLTAENAVRANFLLTASEATKNAELNALERLCGRSIKASERQIHAFNYFVTLRNPEFFVDLHEEIPHLSTAMQRSSWAGSPLAKKFDLLNPQQKAAYLHGFRKLDCGICILPGGPGAGKTHFNLFTIAMAQSQNLPRPVMVGGRLEKRCPKILFIIDMNSPVDDVANRMSALYKELGMKKRIIRMKGWGTEVTSSNRLNAAEDAASGDVMGVDFTNQFLRIIDLMSARRQARSCQAPGLDEAAWERYDEYKRTRYKELAEYLSGDLWEQSQVVPMRLRRLVYNLYRDTLAATDFIATTPVAASNHFNGMFKPDLVYFDEAPHARELTNLIAVANFNPIAWIFCGDHRQTVPYVGSATPECDNIYREQMQISMMERASAAKVIRYELLINHRSFGGLHQLASTMWYEGRMVSGNASTPAALTHIQNYLGGFKNGQACTVPRLLVHLKNCGPEGRSGTSAWNPSHTNWVMKRVLDLVNDKQFRHAERNEPGTILIISPYKKAFNEYKNEIKKLPQWAQKRVETRTVDVVQGHEADFVFLDLVKSKSTEFLDNPNRLCVAVTRARLGEVIMMHPDMVQSTTFKKNSRNLRRIYTLCNEAGQVVHIDPATTPNFPHPGQPAPSRPGLAESIHNPSRSGLAASIHSPSRSGLAASIHSPSRSGLAASRHASGNKSNPSPAASTTSSVLDLPGLTASTRSALARSRHAPVNKSSPSPAASTTSSVLDLPGLTASTRSALARSRHAPPGFGATDEAASTSKKIEQLDDTEGWSKTVMGAGIKSPLGPAPQVNKKDAVAPASLIKEETREEVKDKLGKKSEEEMQKDVKAESGTTLALVSAMFELNL